MVYKHSRCATLVAAVLLLVTGPAAAAPCGKTSAGFENWKRVFANEAQGNGVGPKAIAALDGDQLFDRDHRAPIAASTVSSSASTNSWRSAARRRSHPAADP